jgi:hypothetical protein
VRAGQQLVIPGFKAVSSKGTTTAAPTARPAPAPETPVVSTAQEPAAPKFELTPPPPGQDLDAGLKNTETEVPTIKVEEPAPETN